MRAPVLASSLLLITCGLAVVVVILAGGEPEWASPELDPAGETAASRPGVAAPTSVASRRAEPPRGQPVEEPGEEPAAGQEGLAGHPVEEGVILRGRVRWAEQDEPVPYLRLVVQGA